MAPTPPPDGSPQGAESPVAHATRGDRIRDGIALILIVAGVVLAVFAFVSNNRLATQPIIVAQGQTAYSIWYRNYLMDFGGYALIALGVLVGLGSYIAHARRARRARADRGGAA